MICRKTRLQGASRSSLPPPETDMKKPKPRIDIPPRTSDNVKRKLHAAPDTALIAELSQTARYAGYSKHKAAPEDFGLEPYRKPRGDATLCDKHASFTSEQIPSIPRLLRRGIRAGLIGESPRVIWTVGDDGWIFEGRITNVEQDEYHGYPVRPTELIAEDVYDRYAQWAEAHGNREDKQAATRCQAMYGFKP